MRRLGAAAVDMCHVALGIVEAYWEYRLKPWDMTAGVLVMLPFLHIWATSILLDSAWCLNKPYDTISPFAPKEVPFDYSNFYG